jgi:hypothetical protein
VQPGEIILVADVGGGTSDFSLIAVLERDGVLELHRVAVGEHILLGGDNMDLALAFAVASKLGAQGIKTDAWQLRALTHACRSAKEALLNDAELSEVPLIIASRGAKLIGGSLRSELTRAELTATLLEGFFPDAGDRRPSAGTRSRRPDPARPALRPRRGDHPSPGRFPGPPGRRDGRSRRLHRRPAGRRHFPASDGRAVQRRRLQVGTARRAHAGDDQLLARRRRRATARPLEGADLDLAVARGGAYYGYVRRGQGVRIRGGTARSYYVAIESVMPAVPGMQPPVQALCLAPFGMEEGSDAALPEQEFGLVVGEAVRFRFFGSSVRRQDQVGTLLDDWEPDELQELAEIQTTLPAEGRADGEVVRVKLHARVTEAGTLELEALPHDGPERWKVEFDARDAGGSADAVAKVAD